jgi:hypothetical protein
LLLCPKIHLNVIMLVPLLKGVSHVNVILPKLNFNFFGLETQYLMYYKTTNIYMFYLNLKIY